MLAVVALSPTLLADTIVGSQVEYDRLMQLKEESEDVSTEEVVE